MSLIRITRSKRKLEQLDDPPATKARCLSNLTNVKSPKSRKDVNKIHVNKNFSPKHQHSEVKNETGEDVQAFKIPPPVRRTSRITKVSVEATQTSEIPKDHNEQSSQTVFSQIQTQQLPSGFQDAGVMARTVKQILKKNMMDASRRLHLQIVPCHLYDLKKYIRTSQKQSLQYTSSINQNVSKNFLTEERYYQFIHLVRAMCGQKEFPGSKVACSVLELILVS
jgi:hypothetical protein